MAPRASWKGFLKLGEIACPVGLYTAASTAERISFHMINRRTGNRLNREFEDSDTGKIVERDQQVKGYEISEGRYVELESEEVASAVPDADKMLDIEDFIACNDVDETFFDKPYYLAPADRASVDVFTLVREGLTREKVAAIARTTLFRRYRTLLIRAHGNGLIATTLNYDYEVRPAREVFDHIPARKLDREMLELAGHIIGTKMGHFDPEAFDDRYEAALADLVRAKIEGRKLKKPKPPKQTKPSDLLEALRLSATGGGPKGHAPHKSHSTRKAG